LFFPSWIFYFLECVFYFLADVFNVSCGYILFPRLFFISSPVPARAAKPNVALGIPASICVMAEVRDGGRAKPHNGGPLEQ